MITISQHVDQIIDKWPMLHTALDLELLNVSSVARYIKPEIETRVGEKVSDAAILMAIRRNKQRSNSVSTKRPQDYLGDISVRTSLKDLTVSNSPSLPQRLTHIAQAFSSHDYLTISRGLLQTTLIVHEKHANFILNELNLEHIDKEINNLCAIILQIKRGYGQLPGILAYPLQLLAWRGIPVIEIVSTYDELHIIVYKADTEEAFSTLNQSMNDAAGK